MECNVKGCDRKQRNDSTNAGLCHSHYVGWKRTGKYPTAPIALCDSREGTCKIDGCNSPIMARRMCNKHYIRVKKHGDPNIVLKGMPVRTNLVEAGICHITLSNGSEAICDEIDAELAAAHNWAPVGNKSEYVGTNIRVSLNPLKYKTGYLHRMIMERVGPLLAKQQIDHINHDPRDNRRCNLRIVTCSANIYNSVRTRRSASGYYGVYRTSDGSKWFARVTVKAIHKWSKIFMNKQTAALARDRKLIELYGTAILPTTLNFPGKYLELLMEFGHVLSKE